MKKFLCIFVLLGSSAFSTPCPAQTLRDEADKIGMLVGAAVNPAKFTEDQYASTLAREFNMIEAENVMKWGAVRPKRETFNFQPGDEVVKFAKAHGMKIRGHCLLWSEYNPGWLEKGGYTAEQLSALLREHIARVMKHFSGQVFAWDVVNESFEADGDIETSIWYDAPGIGLKGKGTAYIEQAFRWAREADPKALLFYNDYDAEGLNAKSDAIYSMVKDFKRRGVPIDGVGMQLHIFKLSTDEISSMQQNMKRLTDLGLQVHITEMDVALPMKDGVLTSQADLEKQAEIYRFVATSCLQNPKCTAFQTWGFTDKYSWVPGFTKGEKGEALIFNRNYERKPAYDSLLKALVRGR
jgi:endo-1,4-beta-xylanase